MKTALVLSGGGARGDFQVGAVRYLYDHAILPNIICAASVGAINGIKLAEGHSGALGDLERIWFSLQSNDDMFREEQWFATLGPGIKSIIAATSAESSNKPANEFTVNPLELLMRLGGLGVRCGQICSELSTLKTRFEQHPPPQALYNLVPISAKLHDPANLDLNKVRQSGIKLRLGVVCLESGALRYVTENGLVLGSYSGKHFYTTSEAERAGALTTFGYRDDGIACYVHDTPADGTADELFRLFHPTSGDHLYTTSGTERQSAVYTFGYQYEGVACYVFNWRAPGTIPLYRLVSPIEHFYTTSAAERDNAVANFGFTSEGVACYVFDSKVPGTTPLYRLVQIADPRQPVDLIDAVLASASIPGIFPPRILLGENYVDGGVREILPIQAAIDLGADKVFGIIGSVAVEPADSFTNRNLIDIAARSVEGIMTDEIVRNDSNPPRGWGIPVTIIQPTVNVHDTMTIDPGLIRISMAYGYMVAADSVEGSREHLARSRNLADMITRLRKEIWDLEYEADGQQKPNYYYGTLVPTRSPEALRSVRQKKRELKVLVDERRRLGGTLPSDAEMWWLNWEQHRWMPIISTPWESWNAFVHPSLYVEVQGEHFYTTSATERDSAITNFGYTSEGVACYVYAMPVGGAMGEFFRLVHPTSGDHFYTTSGTERQSAVDTFGYRYEGVACYVYATPVAGTTPFYRLVNNFEHFYTASAAERNFAISMLGYQDEGIACYLFDSQVSGTTELYRLVQVERVGSRAVSGGSYELLGAGAVLT